MAQFSVSRLTRGSAALEATSIASRSKIQMSSASILLQSRVPKPAVPSIVSPLAPIGKKMWIFPKNPAESLRPTVDLRTSTKFKGRQPWP